ncbi:MAG TPA: hypothetical protein PKW07_01430 [Syntrophorhabdaceae bacterium]|nr:hypothetical protein [Syntrophorhabdaceae bacterium]
MQCFSKSRYCRHHRIINDLSKGFLLYLTIIGLIVLSMPCQGMSQPVETCVGCHTSDKTLKMLYKPTKIESAEGEG